MKTVQVISIQVFIVKHDDNCTNPIVVVWRIGKRERGKEGVFVKSEMN
jgi:hypothetical protein